jgi:hypothetical protein
MAASDLLVPVEAGAERLPGVVEIERASSARAASPASATPPSVAPTA